MKNFTEIHNIQSSDTQLTDCIYVRTTELQAVLENQFWSVVTLTFENQNEHENGIWILH